ncbi:hypothetical protein BH23PSE2_BH23PSE2_08470 [soil metagenome]
MKRILWAMAASASLLSACQRTEPAAPPAAEPTGVPASDLVTATTVDPSLVATPPEGLVDRVWRVEQSNAVAAGTRYTFLADGTLVIDADQGTPTRSRWMYEDGALTMFEDGLPYPTDILSLDRDRLELRSNNPGPAVTMTLVPAPDQTLPPAGDLP